MKVRQVEVGPPGQRWYQTVIDTSVMCQKVAHYQHSYHNGVLLLTREGEPEVT